MVVVFPFPDIQCHFGARESDLDLDVLQVSQAPVVPLFGEGAAIASALTLPAAFALLVFCLLYTPCVAAIAAVKRELGAKWAAGLVLEQCAIAWIVALAVKVLFELLL